MEKLSIYFVEYVKNSSFTGIMKVVAPEGKSIKEVKDATLEYLKNSIGISDIRIKYFNKEKFYNRDIISLFTEKEDNCEEPEQWIAVEDGVDKDGNVIWDVEFRDNDGGGMIATVNNCRADKSKDIAERIASLPDVEKQRDELLKDYDGAITKFDNCSLYLARTLEKLGVNPNECPEDREWHEWLIEQLDKADITNNPDK